MESKNAGEGTARLHQIDIREDEELQQLFEQAEPDAELHYKRVRDAFRFKLRGAGLTNHEIRAILVGLWLRLDEDDRRDHINELRHYLEPSSEPAEVSQVIAQAAARKAPSAVQQGGKEP